MKFKIKKEQMMTKRAAHLWRKAQIEIFFIQLVLVAYEVN
jgi:hypothetical protein